MTSARKEEENDYSEAKSFGEKGNYWEMYDEITDKYDQDIMGKLGEGLDNLLIFVSRPG